MSVGYSCLYARYQLIRERREGTSRNQIDFNFQSEGGRIFTIKESSPLVHCHVHHFRTSELNFYQRYVENKKSTNIIYRWLVFHPDLCCNIWTRISKISYLTGCRMSIPLSHET